MNRRTRPFRMLIAAIAGFTLLIPVTPASAAVTTFEVALSGGDTEVPDPGDPDGFGAARVKIDVRREKVCFAIVVFDIGLPTIGSHIHEAPAGEPGDIVVPFKAPVEIGNTGIGLSTGCTRNQPRPLLRDIKNNPDQFYVNVHTSDFPGGAVRGQLG